MTVKQEFINVDIMKKHVEDERKCSICLDQARMGELVRCLPCLHQFRANCIDPWLRQQGKCPVCKLTVGSGQEESRESGLTGEDMV